MPAAIILSQTSQSSAYEVGISNPNSSNTFLLYASAHTADTSCAGCPYNFPLTESSAAAAGSTFAAQLSPLKSTAFFSTLNCVTILNCELCPPNKSAHSPVLSFVINKLSY